MIDLHKLSRIDVPLVVSWALLAILGIVMVLSASSLEADAKYGDWLRFAVRQGAGIGIGLTITAAFLVTPMRWVRKSIYPGFVIVLLSQLMILTPLAHSANGATRWFRLGPLNVQPSEFMKIAFVFALAHYLAINEGRIKDFAIMFASLLLLGAPVVFMAPQSDFGTVVLLFGLAGVLLFVAGLPWLWMTLFGTGVVGVLGLLIAMEPYRIVRLMSFMDPFANASDSGYQVVQGWIALATGGIFGQGITGGVAQRGFLPEAHTDFISAVIGEELGALGWSFMVLLFIVFTWRSLLVASRSKDMFCMLVSVGMASLIAAQAIINLGVVGGLVPNKGLVLPFLSYGASAAMAHTMVMGVLVRMSMEAEPVAEPASKATGFQGWFPSAAKGR